MLWGDQVRAHALGVSVQEAEERDAAVRHYQIVAEEWRSKYYAAERVIRTMSERSVGERAQLGKLSEDMAVQRQQSAPTLTPGWWFAAGAFAAGLVDLALRFW